MNKLFPVNLRKINNSSFANDNYSLSADQAIMARASNVPATGTCTTTVATINMYNHGYIVNDVVTLVGTGVFNGVVTVTAVNQDTFNYTVSTTAVTTPVNLTVTVVTIEVNEYIGTEAPIILTVTQTLASLLLAAPVGSCYPGTIVGVKANSVIVAPGDSSASSVILFTAKTVNIRKVSDPSFTISAVRSTTTVTVTATNHGLLVGQYVTVSGTSTAMDGTFAVATVADVNTFTYTTVSSGTIGATAGTAYHEYTKAFVYKEGARNILHLLNEYYASLTPFFSSLNNNYVPTALTATATLTSAQVANGYVAVTSASAVTLTMPTGTALGTYLHAAQGTEALLTIDNSASTSSGAVTMAVNTNAVQSDWDVQITNATSSVTPAAVTPLTIVVGASGTAVYRIVFTSATTYTFSRTA